MAPQKTPVLEKLFDKYVVNTVSDERCQSEDYDSDDNDDVEHPPSEDDECCNVDERDGTENAHVQSIRRIK